VGKNIARVQALVAEGQALVNVLCRHSVGRTFDGRDSRPSVSVFDLNGGSNAVVFWNPHNEFVYFAPTGSTVRRGHLSGARRGNADDLIRFNVQAQRWLVPQLDSSLTEAPPRHEPHVDPGLAAAKDFIDVLAAHCRGGVFNAPDQSSTVAVVAVAGQARASVEPAIIWADKPGREQSGVYFLPQDSTPNAGVLELMNKVPGSDADLQAFASRVLPWLEPIVEERAGKYLEGLDGQTLAA